MAEIIELKFHRPVKNDESQKTASKFVRTHSIDEDGNLEFHDEETWFTIDSKGNFTRPDGAETTGLQAEIVDLVEIQKEKERQKELQDEYEVEELRAQLRWVLDKIHMKNVTYEAEDLEWPTEDELEELEEAPTALGGAWFRKLFRRKT